MHIIVFYWRSPQTWSRVYVTVGRLSVCLSAQSINKSGRRVCCWVPALAADINQQCCRRRHSAANAGSVTLRGSKWSWLIATDRPASHPDCQCSRRADIDSCSSTSTMPSTAVSSNTTWQPNTTREYSTIADSSFWTELWVNTLLNLLTQRKKQFIYKLIDTHTHTHTRLTALFPGLPRWAGTRKVKPIWITLKQQTVSGSGISWAICKSAPCSRQITMQAPRHSYIWRHVDVACLRNLADDIRYGRQKM